MHSETLLSLNEKDFGFTHIPKKVKLSITQFFMILRMKPPKTL